MKHIKYLFTALALAIFSPLLAQADAIDFATFVTALKDANYNFDGSTHASAVDGKLTVKWSPVSGCFDGRENHTCTVENVTATENTPERVNSELAQFQILNGETSDVTVKNVAFVYEPADFTICANSNWKGSFTADTVKSGQIYLMNTGSMTFEDCSFEKVVLTSFNCTGTSTVKNCSFKDVYNSYAIKDIRGSAVSVTGCSFEDCGAAIMVSAVSAATKIDAVTISGNTFKNVDVEGTTKTEKIGTRGIIQIASSGDYSETTYDFSGNTAENCGPVIRQLNSSVALTTTEIEALKTLVTGSSALLTIDSSAVTSATAMIGTAEYDTLAAALADVAEGKPLSYVTEAAWPVATPVYYDGKFYAKGDSKGALELAIDAANEANSDEAAKIYVRPGFDKNELVLGAHQNLKTSLAIYGNDAKLSGNWEPCIENSGTEYHTLTKDVSIAIYNLHNGAGVWGVRQTGCTVDVTLADCRDVHEIMINGSSADAASSVNNYTVKRCTFDGTLTASKAVTIASTSAGKIVVENCTFANLNENYVINPNNKNGGAMEVIITGTSFTNCGTSSKAVIRVAGEVAGTSATVTLDNLTFDEYSAVNAIAIGKKELAENLADITYTISNTAGTLSVFEKGGSDTTITPTTTTLVATETYKGGNGVAVAKVGDTEYATVDAAMEAAAASATAVTVKLTANSEDATIVPTWFLKSDVTIDADSATTATFAPAENASDALDTDGMAYIASSDADSVRTFTVGENVTLAFPSTSTKKGALYFGYSANTPINVVLNGRIEAYEPYLGKESTLTISDTGSLKSISECLLTRSKSTMTVTGTDGSWSETNPQVSLAYASQQGGEVSFKDTFVNAGAYWTMRNRNGVAESATKLSLDNTALVAGAFNGSEKQDGTTSAYEVELKNGSTMTISGDFAVIADGKVTIEAGSLITAKSISNAGTLTIDATGLGNSIKVVDYTGASEMTLASYGTVVVVGVDGVEAYVEDNDLWVKRPVAQVGENVYGSLAEAFAAAQSGETDKTVKLLGDLQDDSNCLYDLTGVTFDLDGHTYSQYNMVNCFQGTGGAIKNGKMVCLNNGSYALFLGNDAGATTSFTIENVEMAGGINIGNATGVVLKNLNIKAQNYYAVWLDSASEATIESGTYESAEVSKGGSLFNVYNGSVLTLAGGTFNTIGNSLMGNSGGTLVVTGGTFDTAVDAKYCAAGYMPADNGDGTYGVAGVVQVLNADKTVAGSYHSLADAFEAAKAGQTVKLLADLTENATIANDLTLDLNGFTLNGGTVESTPTLMVTAKVTIKDSSAAQTGTIKREDTAENSGVTSHYVIDIQGSDASLTVESGTVVNNSGTTEGERAGASLVRLGDDGKKDAMPTLTIKGGTFTQNNFTAIKVDYGTFYFQGGTITCENDEAVKNWASAYIQGGTVNGTVASWVYSKSISSSTLEISGGTINGNVYAMTYDGTGDKTATVNITGGTITGDLGIYQGKNIKSMTKFSDASKATIAITGGKFSDALDETEATYLAADYTTYETSDKYYAVKLTSSTVMTVKTEDAESTDAKTVEVALPESVLEVVKDATSEEAKAEALSKTADNGNPVWVNLVAGIDSDKNIAVDAEQNTDSATIDVAVPELTVASGFTISYSVDEIEGSVTNAGEVVSAPVINVDNVETSALFRVNVVLRQNGSTVATVPATNYVGVMKKTTKMTKAIVAVPWHSLADGEDITVDNIVKTANLTVGDKLYIYDTAKKLYNVYTLKDDKTWNPTEVYTIDEDGQMSSSSSGTPESTRVARGSGVWLERQDTSTPIVTYGLASTAKQDTELASGTAESPTWNLVAVPSTEPMKLDDLAAATTAANDTIIVPTEGVPRIYTVVNGKWGFEEATKVGNKGGFIERNETDTTLPAGMGFWYLNGSDSEKKVNW